MSLFATDDALASMFFRLSFGMTHFQLFRSLDPVPGAVADVEIRYMESEESIREIDTVHHVFYPNPPLFWIPHGFLDHQESSQPSKKDRVLSGEIEIIAAFVGGTRVG